MAKYGHNVCKFQVSKDTASYQITFSYFDKKNTYHEYEMAKE